MTAFPSIRILDTHTGGEPTRIVLAGGPDLGGGPLVAVDSRDTFVARFSATGEHVYSMRVGEAGVQQAFAVSADPTGAALIAGAAYETFTVGPFALVAAGGNDVLFAKIGP